MIEDIETYLNSLSEDILIININGEGITYLPDLTRFKNLKELNCSNNQLTSLPTLPQNLQILFCTNNQLTSLPTLPQNLQTLYCYNNQLTSLEGLPQNLKELNCSNNKIKFMTLPKKLIFLICYKNQLTSLPALPQNIRLFDCNDNPINEILHNNSLSTVKQHIKILNNFRHLYYCLQFKKQLRKLLWEKVREPHIEKIFHPNYLIENLGDNDLDTVLNTWMQLF